ncbi:MAG: triose-phosphate isomerase [Acidimicrobiales bacterium]|jgi:triosephosphate isomerase
MSTDRGGRRVLVSGNWKMHHTHYEAIQVVQKLAALLRAAPLPEGTDVSLHPSFTSLRSVQTALESDDVPIALGAQSCHFEDSGAYTGEVSAEMLAKLNVRYVIVGHSERRAYFGETDEVVRLKLDAVLRHAMTPILCVGETLEQREAGVAETTVSAQLTAALAERGHEALRSIVIAYEPIWAIGTGRTASADDAQAMSAVIRGGLELLGGEVARAMLVQYGGSVTPNNASELLACPDVDGLLVGGASLDADKFVSIARSGS